MKIDMRHDHDEVDGILQITQERLFADPDLDLQIEDRWLELAVSDVSSIELGVPVGAALEKDGRTLLKKALMT